MATQSASPIDPSDSNNPSVPASESAKMTNGDALSKEGAVNGISPKSVFVNSQPIREDQVENAVKFLSHPKVRGSPVIHRRNFLERKGLTKDEIDEAFRRVPDPSPVVTTVQATSSNQGGQLQASPNIQLQTPVQALQPVTTPPSGALSTLMRRFHWSHAFLFLMASGAGTVIILKKTLIPSLKSWIRKVAFDQEDDPGRRIASRPSLAEEAAAATKAAAAAAADVAKASQEMLITKNEEKVYFKQFMNMLEVQLQEIKSILEEQTHNAVRKPEVVEEYLGGSLTRSKNGASRTEFDTRSVRSSSPGASAEPPHPKSYMEIMAMVRRGEKPPNIREINDLPPNPNQPISNPILAPRSKPWEVNQSPSNSIYAPRPQPQSMNENSSSAFQTNGISYQLNGDSSVPWWQQQQQKNVRITEIESEDSFRAQSNGKSAIDQPSQRKWVPPQALPVSLPEAAIAIRQPKSSEARERLGDNVAQGSNDIEELQRITKISELGGEGVNSGGSEISSSSEIQEEQVIA